MDIGHQLDRMKESFLWAAAKGGREEEVESLLSIGADVNWRNGDEGETPLIAACRSGHRGVAALLLAHGGDAMGTSRNGESALHAACRRGDEELCALLVDAGAHDEGAFEAGVSAGHGAMVSRLRGLGRRHAAAAQASSSRRPPPSIRSAALPAVEPPRRSPRRIRDPAQELLEEVRSGYRERAADAAERRMRDDEPPACPTPQAVDIVAARLDEAAKGRRAEQQKRERAQREADAARAQSNQLLAELMQAQTVASKLREKETSLKRDLRRLRGRGLSGMEVEELASLERDLRAALRRVTLAKEKRLKASVHVPDGYVCPITRELMRDPVFCGDGHTYEREAISVWLMTKDTSPKTGCVLETKALIPNFALRSAIDDLRNRRRLADEVAEDDDAKTLPASPGPLRKKITAVNMSSNPSALYTPQDIKGWTALVTGASSGFGKALCGNQPVRRVRCRAPSSGKATAWRFAELGCKLIIVARRGDRLEALAGELKAKYGTEVFCLVLDMMDIERVEKMDQLLPESFRNVDILVNNAGLALGKNSVEENVTSDIVRMMTTNVTALIIATTLFTKGMKARGRGHVINVGSIAGHYAYGGGSGYCASKSAVTAFTSAARHDLVGTPIRVTCISPGFAETEFSLVRFEASDDAASKAKSVYDNLVPMVADDIADQIVYAATRPAHVQIQDIIAWPTNQAGPTNIARVGPSLGAP